jgi:hypothetical protein
MLGHYFMVWFTAVILIADPLPKAKLPSICGYAVFRICGASQSNRIIPEWVAVSPSAITTITNPPDSPDGCVKIFSLTGRGVYVVGTENEAAALLGKADLERREELCQWN